MAKGCVILSPPGDAEGKGVMASKDSKSGVMVAERPILHRPGVDWDLAPVDETQVQGIDARGVEPVLAIMRGCEDTRTTMACLASASRDWNTHATWIASTVRRRLPVMACASGGGGNPVAPVKTLRRQVFDRPHRRFEVTVHYPPIEKSREPTRLVMRIMLANGRMPKNAATSPRAEEWRTLLDEGHDATAWARLRSPPPKAFARAL